MRAPIPRSKLLKSPNPSADLVLQRQFWWIQIVSSWQVTVGSLPSLPSLFTGACLTEMHGGRSCGYSKPGGHRNEGGQSTACPEQIGARRGLTESAAVESGDPFRESVRVSLSSVRRLPDQQRRRYGVPCEVAVEREGELDGRDEQRDAPTLPREENHQEEYQGGFAGARKSDHMADAVERDCIGADEFGALWRKHGKHGLPLLRSQPVEEIPRNARRILGVLLVESSGYVLKILEPDRDRRPVAFVRSGRRRCREGRNVVRVANDIRTGVPVDAEAETSRVIGRSPVLRGMRQDAEQRREHTL